MNIVNFALEITVNLIEVSLFYYFISHKLKFKNELNHKRTIILGIIVLTSIVTAFNIIGLNVYISLLFFLFYQIFFTFIFTKGESSEKVMYGCTYEVIVIIADSAPYFLSFFLTSINAKELTDTYPQRYILVGLFVMILSILTIWESKRKNENVLLPNNIKAVLLMLITSSVLTVEWIIGICIELSGRHQKIMKKLYLVILAFLAILIFTTILITYIGRLYEKNKKLYEESQQKIIEQKKFDLMQNTVKTLRAWKHDSQRHITVLKELVEQDRNTEVSGYIAELFDISKNNNWGEYSGNDILDALISINMERIKEKNIKLNLSAFLPRALPLNSVLISSILGNLIDNAVDACSRIEETEKRYIKIKTRVLDQVFIFEIENSSTGEYIREKERFLSLKKSEQNGFGMRNIENAARQLNGIFSIEAGKEKFRAKVTIPT